MQNEFKNNNLIARITESHGKFNVRVVQVSNNGLELVEDLVDLKTGITTHNRAKSFALKQIG